MSRPRLEEIVDRCIDDLAAGRRSVEQCLETYPERREELAPLLSAASAVGALPRMPERAPDPGRRAAFMAELARTPQEQPRGLHVPAFVRSFRLGGGLPRLAAMAAPAAAVVVLAFVLLVSSGGSTAHAATVTIFDGSVQRATDNGQWETVSDGQVVREGDVLRTSDTGRALMTFADGSTAALGAQTELTLRVLRVDGERRVAIEQLRGDLWVDVAGTDDADGGVAYTVQTPDASVTARGIFETRVQEGETEVRTAAGHVEVRAGEARAMVAPGESVLVTDQRLVEHPAARRPLAELLVNGPFVASLLGPDGAATGARLDGVLFHQLPGVTTSDPGDGPQRLDVHELPPGAYSLLLRRFGEGGGTLAIASGGADETLSLGSEEGLVVQFLVEGAGTSARLDLVRVVRDEPATPERIVQSPRTRAAVSPRERRAEQDAGTPAGTLSGTGVPSGTAGGGPPTPEELEAGLPTGTAGLPTGAAGTPTGTAPPTATAPAIEVPPVTATATIPTTPTTPVATPTPQPTPDAVARYREQLLTAIDAADPSAYRLLLEEALMSPTRFSVVLETLEGSAGMVMLRSAIGMDSAAGGSLGRRVAAAIETQAAPAERASLLQALGIDGLAGPPPTATPTATPTPTGTTTPTATATPTPTPTTDGTP
ncbi:MAG: hypothetical protein GEU80_08760 [Dehalococcoidia bacterium]|nr:hypothetical protein [Dehalococcoidia bacterium]